MHMFVDIDFITGYGRYYPGEAESNDTFWWFNRNDYKIYSTDYLIMTFHFKNCFEIEESGVYIALFQTDIEKLGKEYLLTLTRDEINEYKKIQAKNKTKEPDTIFKIFIDSLRLWKDWYTFEHRKLSQDAIAWCKANNIIFTEKQ